MTREEAIKFKEISFTKAETALKGWKYMDPDGLKGFGKTLSWLLGAKKREGDLSPEELLEPPQAASRPAAPAAPAAFRNW